MAPTLLQSIPVDGPGDRHVRVLFYDDGSVRIRIANAAPMKISEAFLRGKGDHVIVKLDPEVALHSEGRSLLVREPEDERAETIEMLQAGDVIGIAERAKRIAERLGYETAKFRDANQQNGAEWGIVVQTEPVADRVTGALFDAVGARMHELTALGAAVIQYRPESAGPIGHALFRVFQSEGANSPLTLQAIPRLVSAVSAQTLLGYAIALGQYQAFAEISKPRSASLDGGAPWTTTQDFHHLRTLGGDSLLSAKAALRFAEGEAHDAVGLSIVELKNGIIGAGLLAEICSLAHNSVEGAPFPWTFRYRLDGVEPMLSDIATNDASCAPIAAVAGESVAAFRAAFRGRHDAYLKLMISSSPYLPSPHMFPVREETLALFDKATGR